MSDIKMVGTMSESIQRIYKGSKKYKIQTKEVKFKNKKNEFCSIERDDLVERLETSLTKFEKGYGYLINVFFENYGWRQCPDYFTSDSTSIMIWNAEYNNEDNEEVGEIWAVRIDKVPLNLFEGK
jgi:hypothetical protein